MSINYTEKRSTATCDVETFPNYWSIGFRCMETGRTRVFEQCEDLGIELDRQGIANIVKKWRLITFNGNHYDMCMIALAMRGATNAELKNASDEIIQTNLRAWEFYDRYELKLPPFLDHIDLIEVAPARPQELSLKGYAGRLHSKTMQDLPFPPDTWLTREQMEVVRKYHGNDMIVTAELAAELKNQLDVRAAASQRYGIDLRSKSDAQMGEAIVKHRVEKITGRKIYKPEIERGFIQYVAPAYIHYETPELQQMLDTVLRTKIRIRGDGYVDSPELKALNMTIGGRPFQMGLGGLHSQESSVSHYSDDDYTLRDRDVTGYYPNLIIASGRYPKSMGVHFQTVFREIVREREAAKAAMKIAIKANNKKGEKDYGDEAETGKITTNGIFGKTGSPWAVVYSPDLMVYTTLTGQLSILMLIEQATLRGWEVVSANTDGFVTRVPNVDTDIFNALIMQWEWESGLQTEETVYRSLHSRDVNNYLGLAVEHDGKIKVKRKGEYAESGRGVKAAYGLKKNPNMDICNDAVIEFLKDGTSIESTIRNCQDIRKFIVVQRVSGGGYKDGEYIGKWIRYYYGDDTPGPITNGNDGKVGMSEGGCPCMVLPDKLPDNIDYARYEREAYAMLRDMGVYVDDPDHRGRSGFVYARMPDQKTFHRVDLSTGRAACGQTKKSLREPWLEVDALPADAPKRAFCSKCRKADEL